MNCGIGIHLGGRVIAGGGSGTPPESASLWWDLDASRGLFQDSGATTPATANGDPVGYMTDYSGRSNHAAQSTSSQRWTLYTNMVNGLPAIKADGVDDRLVVGSSVVHGIGTGDYAIFAVLRPQSGVFLPIWWNGSGNLNHWITNGRLAVNPNNFTTVMSTSNYYITAVGRESGTFKAWINGVQDVTTFSNTQNLASAAWVLGMDGLGNFFNGYIARILIYKAFDWSKRGDVESYLNGIYARF